MKNEQAIQPYLTFGGRCEEAIDFYAKTIGAKLEMLMRFKDAPGISGCPADYLNKVMHASLRLGDTVLMASDGCWTEKETGFKGFSLSLSVPDEDEADRKFNALAKGGQVIMPMDKTFFAHRFGMVADRFGVSWMVIVPAEEPVTAGKREAAAVC